MTLQEEKAIEKLETEYKAVSLHPSDFCPNLLYHYTSASALAEIISSGVLRASNFSYLNDSTEVRYGCQLAQEVIRERLEREEIRVNRQMLLHVEKALKDIGKGLEFYLVCFCTEPDLLSQWRAYGSAKGRYCIGFDTENLPSGLKYTLSRVLYDPAKQRRKMQWVIDAAVKMLAAGSGGDFVERVRELMADKLVNVLCFFKHPGFAEEHEWRAVHAVEPADRIEFDTSSGLIKPFVELWVGLKQEDGSRRLPIVEVVVGAAASVAQSMRSVELLLSRHGYSSVQIKESSVPYREL